MRLLHFDSSGRLLLTDFRSHSLPPYAILSHIWGEPNSEVLFGDIESNAYHKKDGYRKIEFCAKQAAQDQLMYFWIDTCCIDKWNLRELSSSINSMFRWYKDASRCYVFLSDVSVPSTHQQSDWEASFRRSRWFLRGWTLQELIAPISVEFYSNEGRRIGDKTSLEQLVHEITNLPLAALRNCPLDQFTITERMEWAKNRITTEEEDIVYCLLGVLGISIPVSYGEGKEKALGRLIAELQVANSADDAASDSTYESVISDTASMWSVDFSDSSQSSNGALQYVTESATMKMAEVFWQSHELQSLYLDASNRLPKDVFAKTHDDLLKTFFANLRSETSNDKQLNTVRILRRRTHREQITGWIYHLAGPKMDSETLQARHAYLTQQESRDELLERFLQSLTRSGTAAKEIDSEPLAAGDSSDEDEEDAVSLEELNAIVHFLMGGSSFEILRINLHGLAHPETAITQALRTGKIEVLQALLVKQLNRVATGEFEWIKELDAAGYSKDEIAHLLLEGAADSPWIIFMPRVTDLASRVFAEQGFHVRGCVHTSPLHRPDPECAATLILSDSDTCRDVIQELCGIAGVAPHSPHADDWNGSVLFTETNSAATVTYAVAKEESQDQSQISLGRCIYTLQALLSAIGHLQRSKACCSAYSVIIHDEMPAVTMSENPSHSGAVEMQLITVTSLESLLKELKKVKLVAKIRQLDKLEVSMLQNSSLAILTILGRTYFPPLARLNYVETLHVVALAVQFASLAFLLYSQAHIAPIQPFYLDTALSKISLIGISDLRKPTLHITAKVARLNCVGDMLHAPVIVFSAGPSSVLGDPLSLGPRANLKYDIIASAEDLIGKRFAL
jgi:hypothetical protein